MSDLIKILADIGKDYTEIAELLIKHGTKQTTEGE